MGFFGKLATFVAVMILWTVVLISLGDEHWSFDNRVGFASLELLGSAIAIQMINSNSRFARRYIWPLPKVLMVYMVAFIILSAFYALVVVAIYL